MDFIFNQPFRFQFNVLCQSVKLVAFSVKLGSSTAISKQQAQQARTILSVSPVRKEECEAKRKQGNEVQRKNRESHLLPMTEYSQTADKEIQL